MMRQLINVPSTWQHSYIHYASQAGGWCVPVDSIGLVMMPVDTLRGLKMASGSLASRAAAFVVDKVNVWVR